MSATKTKQPDFLDDGLAKESEAEQHEPDQPAPTTAIAVSELPVVQANDPLALVMAAVQNDSIDADKLERLLALYERHEANKKRDAYNAAMSAAQAEMEPVKRDRMNTHTKAKYAQLESIDAGIRPIYTKHGFSLSFGTLAGAPPKHYRLFCDCRHKEGHVERIEADFPSDDAGMNGSVNKTPIQAMVSTSSYARRCLTCLVFNVATFGEDNDGNSQAELITPADIGRINDALGRMPPDAQEAVVARILKWLQIQTLDQIPRSEFRKALDGVLKEGDRFSQ